MVAGLGRTASGKLTGGGRMKRFLSGLILTLLITFSFGGVAHADSLATVAQSPLRQSEPVIQQMTQNVSDRQDALSDQNYQITQLLQKKQDLSTQLDQAQRDIADLNQKIVDKKAAVEAEQKRVDKLKAMFAHINLYAPDSAGNLYAFGNCTRYAKSRRPDLPNSLGNANTWYSIAASEGWSVGSAPKKGAVGTSTAGRLGHVVYIEGVSLDGSTVYISEMNYAGFDLISTRIAPASEFLYIYELD